MIMHLFVFTARTNNRNKYPLFGLTELGSVTSSWPRIPALKAALGGDRFIPYAQCYSTTVKGLEIRVPLLARPNLLTYLLGEVYVSESARFRAVWDEVNTQRTLHEILEVISPTVALEARLEVVVTDANTSFLGTFMHRRLSRAVVREGLLVKVSTVTLLFLLRGYVVVLQVPAGDLGGYVSAVVKEFYGPLEAAVKGTLTGPGTLGTVVLCESLLSFLPSGSPLDQPTYVFRAYDILPLGKLQMSRRVDLGRFGTIKSGVLYIRRPALQRIWIPALPFWVLRPMQQL